MLGAVEGLAIGSGGGISWGGEFAVPPAVVGRDGTLLCRISAGTTSSGAGFPSTTLLSEVLLFAVDGGDPSPGGAAGAFWSSGLLVTECLNADMTELRELVREMDTREALLLGTKSDDPSPFPLRVLCTSP